MDLLSSLVDPGPKALPDQISPGNPMALYAVRLVIPCLYKSADQNAMALCVFSTVLAFPIVVPVPSKTNVKKR